MHEVDAPAGEGIGFADEVARVIHHIGVVAVAAGHRVGADAAVEDVGGGIAGEDVGEFVAGGVDGGSAGEGEVLEIGTEDARDARLNAVDAFIEVLEEAVQGAVDHVAVVIHTADQDVGAGTAGQRVVALAAGERVDRGIAGEGVVCAVAGQIEIDGIAQGRVFQVATQNVGVTGLVDLDDYRVITVFRALDNNIAGAIDDKRIIPRSAVQNIVSRSSIKHILCCIAEQTVVEKVAGEVNLCLSRLRRIDGLQICAQRQCRCVRKIADNATQHQPVVAFTGVLDHCVFQLDRCRGAGSQLHQVDQINVVALATP